MAGIERAETGYRPEARARHDALVAAAREMIPRLRERAQRAEELRRLPDETVRDLLDAGIFRMLKPARYGGYELDYGSIQLDVARELGRGCGSTAWVATVVACHDWILGMFPSDGQDEVWGETPDTLVVSALAPEPGTVRIEVDDDGHVLSGRWKFASGVDHCDWAVVGAQLPRDGAPPEFRLFVMRRSDYTIDDTWFSPGLAGTGSKDIVAAEAHVPQRRSVAVSELGGGPTPGSAVNPSHIYALPLSSVFPFNICVPSIGIARGMLEAFVESTSGRVSTFAGASMAQFATVQVRTSEAAVEIDCADMLVARAAAEVNELGRRGEAMTLAHRVRYRRDLSYAALLCKRAAERIIAVTGAHGLVRHSVEQRALRDLYAVNAQIGLQWDVNAPLYAQHAFGLDLGDRRI